MLIPYNRGDTSPYNRESTVEPADEIMLYTDVHVYLQSSSHVNEYDTKGDHTLGNNVAMNPIIFSVKTDILLEVHSVA